MRWRLIVRSAAVVAVSVTAVAAYEPAHDLVDRVRQHNPPPPCSIFVTDSGNGESVVIPREMLRGWSQEYKRVDPAIRQTIAADAPGGDGFSQWMDQNHPGWRASPYKDALCHT